MERSSAGAANGGVEQGGGVGRWTLWYQGRDQWGRRPSQRALEPFPGRRERRWGDPQWRLFFNLDFATPQVPVSAFLSHSWSASTRKY